MEPRHKSIKCLASSGFHTIHYVEWGPIKSSKTVVCVHGFSRNGRDFDYLAKFLASKGYRVICPDMPGRNKSDWQPNLSDYSVPRHMSELMILLARLDTDHVDWIGTSMGGIIGMGLASFDNTPIKNLVINDVGPYIPAAPLSRIKQYLSLMPEFKTFESARRFVQQLLQPFGISTETQLDHMVQHSLNKNEYGNYILNYDPKLVESFKDEDTDLWYVWETITCPVLVIRGADSEVLTKDTVEKMLERDNVDFAQFSDVAHAPALMDQEQIDTIANWLENKHKND